MHTEARKGKRKGRSQISGRGHVTLSWHDTQTLEVVRNTTLHSEGAGLVASETFGRTETIEKGKVGSDENREKLLQDG